MTTARDITIYQGQAFALSLDYAGTAGRGQRMHIRLADGTATIVQALSHNGAANARVIYNDSTQQIDITIGASISAAWVVLADRVEWVYDIEDYDLADEDDCVIPYRGKVIVRGNRTRASDVTPSEQMPSGDGRYVRFDTDAQGLSDAQKLAARTNIGAGTGGGGGSAAWGDITGTLSAQTDLQSALDLKAPLASPTLTGTPAAPTAAGGTSTTQIATTAFTAGEITTHAGATDPHGDRAFATSAVSTHNAVTTAHGISAFGATLVDDADAATARTTLGLGTAATTAATDYATSGHTHSGVYQPADAELTAIAGLTSAADSAPYFTGSGTAALMTVTAAGRALIDDADASAQRTTLGLTALATTTPGTGVGTALAVNTGTAGAFVVNGGALGTPTSGVLANCTFPTLNQNTSGYAEALKSATTTVSVSAATAPSSGQVLTATSSTAATWQTPSSGGTKTIARFVAADNDPPAASFATIDTRNSLRVLDFDDASVESAVFAGRIPEAAVLTSGILVKIDWMATSATTGNVRWRAEFERGTTDLDSDSFDTATEATGAANGTSGIATTTDITCTTIDSLVAGDRFRCRISRVGNDGTNDTMSGDAELVTVELRAV